MAEETPPLPRFAVTLAEESGRFGGLLDEQSVLVSWTSMTLYNSLASGGAAAERGPVAEEGRQSIKDGARKSASPANAAILMEWNGILRDGPNVTSKKEKCVVNK